MPITHRTGQLVDQVLTQIAQQFRPTGFVADQVAPRINVTNESGKFIKYDAWPFFNVNSDYLQPDRATTREIRLSATEDTYRAEEYAVRSSVSERERSNTDNAFRLQQSVLAMLQDQLGLAREVRLATILQESGTSGGELDTSNESTPTANWDVDTATIEADIVTAKEGIYDDIGYEPNTIVIPYKVANAIAKQADIREIFKYTVNGQQVLAEGQGILPAQIWGLRVLIPLGRKVTTTEGATETFDDIWGDDPRVLYVAPNAGWGTPSVAYQFAVRGARVDRWSENDPPGLEVIRVSELQDEKVAVPKAGWHIKDVLS